MSLRVLPHPDAHTRRILFESPNLSVADFCCEARAGPEGAEEPNATHSIVLVRRGLFSRTHRSESLIADPNQILFFNGGEPYRYAHPLPGGDACTILAIADPAIREVVSRHSPHDAEQAEAPLRFGHCLISRPVAALHYELLALVRNRASRLELDDLLAELMDRAVHAAYQAYGAAERNRRQYAEATRRRQRDLVEAAKLLLNRSLEAPPSLWDLSKGLGCSPFHLSHTFRGIVGSSLKRYLAQLRANAAAQRLVMGTQDLTTLALELGYSDHSHFTNAFRQEWGVPPSRFRAMFHLVAARTRSYKSKG